MTVGDEFKASAQGQLLDLARTALNQHEFLDHCKITNEDDLAAFDYDFTSIETLVSEIGIDVRRLARYYRDGGTE